MDTPEGHVEGKTVSASTYKNHKCRCEGCRRRATEYQRVQRSRGGRIKLHDKAQSLATYRASQWVRLNYPKVWEATYKQALADAERKASVTPSEETV